MKRDLCIPVMVLMKSPLIPTGVYTFHFHVDTYIYAYEPGAVFTYSMDLNKLAKALCGHCVQKVDQRKQSRNPR